MRTGYDTKDVSEEQPLAGADPPDRRGHGRRCRFLFYSHDGLGLGHVRRNLAIASAVAELAPAASILVATSADEAEQLGLPPHVDVLKLPGLRKVGNGRYASRRLPLSGADVRAVRASLLVAAVTSFQPDVLLADKHPLGVDSELAPALEEARAAGTHTVLGLRDVLDDAAAVRAEWDAHDLFGSVAELYERVFVYGQPDVLDVRSEYGFPDELAERTRFCGYVVGRPRPRAVRARDGRARRAAPVLAAAGGGEDGYALLAAFAEAAVGAGWDAGIVTGPHCRPPQVRRLRALSAQAGISFRRFVPGLASEFPSLGALVCMGGYNTLAEAVACGVRTICVPRVRPRTEQLIRARAFARRGLVELVEPDRLEPGALRAAVDAALADGGARDRGDGRLDLEGAQTAAAELLELASGRARVPVPAGATAP